MTELTNIDSRCEFPLKRTNLEKIRFKNCHVEYWDDGWMQISAQGTIEVLNDWMQKCIEGPRID